MILCGDALEMLKTLPDESVDSIVTDPPAGISFMGKEWDHHKGGRDAWIKWMQSIASECLRIIKPGGHALVWALPRTSHWTATAWENAGFEVRDRIGHIFGQGFPKSLDVSKAIDKEAGVERKVVGIAKGTGKQNPEWNGTAQGRSENYLKPEYDKTIPTSDAAKQWDGWGTALKPAVEDWWLLRRPISENTVAANVLKWGTGAINVDGCRVPGVLEGDPNRFTKAYSMGEGHEGWKRPAHENYTPPVVRNEGRYPAHLIHDGSEEVLEVFPNVKSGMMKAGTQRNQGGGYHGHFPGEATAIDTYADSGSAARFFYTAKASRRERERGLKGCERKPKLWSSGTSSPGTFQAEGTDRKSTNHHPTVKPLALMEYLVRLITPPGGTVLDCFCGSGTTGIACIREGFQFIGIDSDPEYVEITKRRLGRWSKDGKQLSLASINPLFTESK